MAVEDLKRDFVMGNNVAQKIPAGGVVTNCSDCGTSVVIDAKGVTELGRRPAAVVLCPVCANPELAKQVKGERGLLEKMVDAAKGGPDPDKLVKDMLLKKVDELAKQFAPYELRSHFDFDPPEICDLVEATKKELPDRFQWKWMNDTGTPVMITQRRKEPNGLDKQLMIPHGDEFAIEMPKAEALNIPGFPVTGASQRRPVRDNPQA